MCETAFGTGQLLVKLRTRFVIVSIYNTSPAHALQGAPRRMLRCTARGNRSQGYATGLIGPQYPTTQHNTQRKERARSHAHPREIP